MRFRTVLLLLALCQFAVAGWLAFASAPSHTRTETGAEPAAQPKVAIAVVRRPLHAGASIVPGDIEWEDVAEERRRPNYIEKTRSSLTDYDGAIARKAFAVGEALTSGDILKATDRNFLSAALQPDKRAVAIAVDATQTSSGLVLSGDRVDVILVQTLSSGENDPARKSVAETILRDLRVIAIDQAINSQTPKASGADNAVFGESHMPRTVTLEVTEDQAQRLVLAGSIGKLQLSIRPLEVSPTPAHDAVRLTWASDVSPALNQLIVKAPASVPSNSSIETSIRRVPGT